MGIPLYIILDSPGGNALGGMLLGETIRDQGLHTRVGRTVPDVGSFHTTVRGRCMSACAFAFLGGVNRQAKADEIGVHQFYNDAALEEPNSKAFSSLDLSSSQLLSALLIDYVFRMDVDPRFVSMAAAVMPGDMYFFNDAELDELEVNWDPNKFEDWRIEPFRGGVVAFSRSRDEALTATVFCRSGDGEGWLLMTWEEQRAIEAVMDTFEAIDGLTVMGVDIDRQRISLSNGGDAVRLQIKIPELRSVSFSDLDEHQFAISASEHAPRFAWGPYHWQLAPGGAEAAIGVALRNCF